MIKSPFAFLFLVLCLTAGCTSETFEPEGSITGENYFPLKTGSFIEYDVTEINYLFVPISIDTNSYQLREVVADSFPGINNETVYRLERLKRPDSTQSWNIDSVWTVRKTPYELIKTENNTPFVKLIFPLTTTTEWDGNKYNTLDGPSGREQDLYKVESLGDTCLINGVSFANCLVVEQNNDSNCVNADIRTEIYAKNIGLVYKESRRYNFVQNINLGCNDSIETGTKYYQTIKKYGKE